MTARGPRRPKPGGSFADLHPELAAEWHPTRNKPLTASEVMPSSGLRVWWLCRACGHEWAAVVANRRRGTGCPRHQHNPMNLAESLAGQSPQLAEQWHPTRNGALTAADVLPGSHRRVWWLCPECGHAWQARILARRHGSGCPACYNRRRTLWPSPPAGTSLADMFPEVAAEWDADANGDLTPEQVYPRSSRAVWWRCAVCGHRYEARIGARTQGKRCPGCRTRPSATGPMPVTG